MPHHTSVPQHSQLPAMSIDITDIQYAGRFIRRRRGDRLCAMPLWIAAHPNVALRRHRDCRQLHNQSKTPRPTRRRKRDLYVPVCRLRAIGDAGRGTRPPIYEACVTVMLAPPAGAGEALVLQGGINGRAMVATAAVSRCFVCSHPCTTATESTAAAMGSKMTVQCSLRTRSSSIAATLRKTFLVSCRASWRELGKAYIRLSAHHPHAPP